MNSIFSSVTFAALALPLIMSASCSSGSAGAAERLDLCAYALHYADEFDDLAVAPRKLENGARWTAHTPWNGDFGDATFSDPRPDWPFAISKGILQITAHRDENQRWRSGLIAAADGSGAGHGVQYGYFEARMKFPSGPGVWPAFWLMSQQPARQTPKIEIDAVEYYGHIDDKYFVTGHVWYGGKDEHRTRHDGKRLSVPAGSLTAGFHRYGVRVDAKQITYFLDGEAMWQQPTPEEHRAPLYPLVNLALGSGYPIDKTPDPSTLEVDYVRIYRPQPGGEGVECGIPKDSADRPKSPLPPKPAGQ
jgi:Glycosyl hydrolases family 16